MPPRKHSLRGSVLQRASVSSAQADKVHTATRAFVRQFAVAEDRLEREQTTHASINDRLRSTAAYEGTVCNLHLAFDEVAEETWLHFVHRAEACLEQHAGLASGAGATAIQGRTGIKCKGVTHEPSCYDNKECLLEYTFGKFLKHFSAIREKRNNSAASLPYWPSFLGLPHPEECSDEGLADTIRVAFTLQRSDAGRAAFQFLFGKQASAVFPGGRVQLANGKWPADLMQAADRIYDDWHKMLVCSLLPSHARGAQFSMLSFVHPYCACSHFSCCFDVISLFNARCTA